MLPELPFPGFDPFFQNQLHEWPVPPLMPARIAAAHRDRYQVWCVAGTLDARLSGSTRRSLGDEALPGVGDWVVVAPPAAPADVAVIRGVLERRTVFVRAAAGRAARPQVVAANVDRVFVVFGLDAGANLHAIERYLARVWAGGAEPQVVLNKADLAPDAAAAAAEVEGRCPGLPVHVVSALAADGLDGVRAAIPPGCTVALVGPSGAGKSTLANALLGEDRLATGAVRADARGRHTTTRRELVLLPGSGILLDTPGMRELEVVDDAGLDAVFEDIAELAQGCRFGDCRHLTEPGCAVRDAVDAGALDPDRLEHYRKLEREAAAFQRRHDARARRQEARLWGQLEREVRQQRRWKEGE
ncbi:MAG: ribosome small subunit-dependent GTPase A [Gemmatimonadota bacterium]